MSDTEKLVRMKADTFLARLRLGLGFAGPVHVPEDLTISDTAITHLCDTLCVDGNLNLTGCVNLRTLPARLIVRGKLTINDCREITSLPATLREVFGFRAANCSKLTSIAPIVECRGELDLTGCTAMAPLSPTFTAIGRARFSDCRITHASVFVKMMMPEVIMNSLVGKRVGDVLSLSLLNGHPVLDAEITGMLEMEYWGGMILYADTSLLVHQPPKSR